MTPTAYADISSANDIVPTAALKLTCALGLTSSSRVLLVGKFFSAWIGTDLAELMRTDVSLSVPEAVPDPATSKYDLVCLDLTSVQESASLAVLFRRVNTISVSDATILCLTSRSLIPRTAVDAESGVETVRGSGVRHRAMYHALRGAGFEQVDSFLPFPSLADPSEFVSSECGKVALPSYATMIARVAAVLGIYHRFHPDRIWFASKRGSRGIRQLLSHSSLAIDSSAAPQSLSLLVDRFDFRSRGALLLFASHVDETPAFLLRVAVSPAIDVVLGRNFTISRELHALANMPEASKRLIPKAIARFESDGCVVYVEERMVGTLAWKFEREGPRARRALDEAIAFARTLADSTARHVIMTARDVDHLIGADLASINETLSGGSLASDSIARISRAVSRALIGREVRIVRGHGDFGFGNLLCDSVTGELKAVIDWDTSVEFELDGVDEANLILQLERDRFDGDLELAFLSRARELDSTPRRSDSGGLEQVARPAGNNALELCISGIRMISRSVPYRYEFSSNREGYISLLHVVAVMSERLTDA